MPLRAAVSPTPSPTAAASPSATGTAASTPTPVPWEEIANDATKASEQLQKIEQQMVTDQAAATQSVEKIKSALPKLTDEIAVSETETEKILAESPSLETLRLQEQAWQERRGSLAAWENELAQRADQLDKDVAAIDQLGGKWGKTLKQVVPSGKPEPGAPAEAVARIETLLGSIQQARPGFGARAKDERIKILALKNQVTAVTIRLDSVLASLESAHGEAVNRLFSKRGTPIWKTGLQWGKNETHASFSGDVANMLAYAAAEPERFLAHAGVFSVLLAALYWVRRRVKPWAGEEPRVERAALIFDLPVATALVLSVLGMGWLYPHAPPLLHAVLRATALIPTVLILRRLVEKPLFPVLDALVAFFFVDQLRTVAASAPVVARWLFLGEMAGGMLFAGWLIKSSRAGTLKTVTAGARAALAVFTTAFLANAFGYVSLAELLGDATLGSAYLAVILYASTRIADGLIMLALSAYPLAMLRMVNRHRYLLWSRARRLFQGAAFLLWGMRTLDLLGVRAALVQKTGEALTHPLNLGYLDFSMQRFLAFGLVTWAAFLISRFCRFALEEDVYPRIRLARGLPYAVSTMLHYTILVVGFFVAAAAAKIDMTKFTIVAGAVGVGLGFGLQNIINNFVSGLILLFERPVKVGDVIQLGDVAGTVQGIGIRASVLRTGNGSEIIVPNGILISGQVINWTLSNRQRGIEIHIRVAYGTDPSRVIALLTNLAKAHPLVSADPAPSALFSKFGPDALEFVLHAWTNDFDQWAQIQSDLGIAINAAFLKEGIVIPHPAG